MLLAGVSAHAVSCTPQAEMPAPDREAVMAAATPIAGAIASQNLTSSKPRSCLRLSRLEGIRGGAQAAAPLLKGGELHWRNAYFLTATELKGPTDTQFFCTTPDSSLTVTINLRSLPPGQYALVLGEYTGSPMDGQIALILGFDSKWKLGGLSFARAP